jgi:phosphoglycerol transferase MdoB-like AlkP superfamily enzyme
VNFMSTLISRYAAALSRGRFRLWGALAGFYLIVSTLTRATLFVVSVLANQAEVTDAAGVFAVGLFYDLVVALYLFAPLAFYLAVLPERIYLARWHRRLLTFVSTLGVFGLLYLGAVEYFFFDEFNARFNFVAVEYLIYPHEVFVNIWDSYPVAKVLVVAGLLTAVTMWMLRRLMSAKEQPVRRSERFVGAALLALMLSAAHAGINLDSGRYSDNRVINELALNGVYAFFSAAAHADLDYPAFYLTMPDEEADVRLRQVVAPHGKFQPTGEHLERHIDALGPRNRLNVIVLLQESLGAEFVGVYGDKRGLTPNLDKLASESLLFTRAYATGTRTVRGMEAVTASFPPVPAESIVKRPGNSGLFNWSTVMSQNGYVPTFIYGGYGTFDNMNAFFGSNGYRVIDRTDMDEPRFANIWGVSDEDLFRNAVRVYDRQYAGAERIFSVIMSTSNHKPFTFPEGVPGVPSQGGGREAGVRFADYSIGKFFEAARTRPWFDNTLFVIVADHGARVYGRENIPVRTYEIPLLLYSPKHVRPGRVTTLTSQIDIAPTVLALLDFSYDSTFFGIDVLHDAWPGRFIPLNHNRDVALFDGENLVELGFRKTASQFHYEPVSDSQAAVALDTERLKDAIAVFQEGYELYHEGIYRMPE